MVEFTNGVECEKASEDVIELAIRLTLERCTRDGGDVSVAVISDDEMRALNRDYRKIDAPTDVLAFAQSEGEAIAAPGIDVFWGDIAISLDTARKQAAAYGHSLERELAELAIHAALHLFGHDHMTDAEMAHMQALQMQILEKMELPK